MGLGWPDEAVERARARIGRALFGARADVRPIVGRFEVESPMPPPGISARVAARDSTTGRPVVLHFRADAEPDPRATSLRHPNVVPVRETFEHAGSFVFVSEHVPAESLRAWVERRPRLVHEIVLAHLDAACGLEAAHAVGLAHRGLSADRVLRDSTGSVRVLAADLVRSSGQRGVRRDVVALCDVLRGSLLLNAAGGAPIERVHAVLERWCLRAQDRTVEMIALREDLVRALSISPPAAAACRRRT